MHARAHSRGFTLFELLVVVALAALALGIMGVGLSKVLTASADRSALTQLVTTIRAARTLAITSGSPVQAVFDLQKRTIRAAGRKPVVWPAGTTIQLTTARGLGSAIEFYPDGASSGGNVLVENGQKSWRIDVGWLTGSTELKPLK